MYGCYSYVLITVWPTDIPPPKKNYVTLFLQYSYALNIWSKIFWPTDILLTKCYTVSSIQLRTHHLVKNHFADRPLPKNVTMFHRYSYVLVIWLKTICPTDILPTKYLSKQLQHCLLVDRRFSCCMCRPNVCRPSAFRPKGSDPF